MAAALRESVIQRVRGRLKGARPSIGEVPPECLVQMHWNTAVEPVLTSAFGIEEHGSLRGPDDGADDGADMADDMPSCEELRETQNVTWAQESVQYGVSRAKAGQYAEALEAYGKALDLCPRNVDAWVGRGAAFANQNRLKEAVAEFERAVAIDPEHRNALAYREATLQKLRGTTAAGVAAARTNCGCGGGGLGSAHAAATKVTANPVVRAPAAARDVVVAPVQAHVAPVAEGARAGVAEEGESGSEQRREESDRRRRKAERRERRRAGKRDKQRHGGKGKSSKSEKKSKKRRRRDESASSSDSSDELLDRSSAPSLSLQTLTEAAATDEPASERGAGRLSAPVVSKRNLLRLAAGVDTAGYTFV